VADGVDDAPGIDGVEADDGVGEIDGDSAGEARGDPEDLRLAGGTR
jgi:hypothetical protein